MQQTAAQTKKPFYGWRVALGMAMVFGASAGLFFNCNAVFTEPVPTDLGFSRGAFSMYTTIGGLGNMAAMMAYGELYRRHPLSIRKFMLAGSVLCSACVLGYSFSSRLWHFYALSILFGLMQSTISGLSLTTILNHWFVEKKGLAIGIAFAGSGVVAAVAAPAVTKIVAVYGWRWGYRALALSGLAILLFAILVLIREHPSQLGQQPLGLERLQGVEGAPPQPAEMTGLTRAQAMRTPAVYLLVAGFIGIGVCGNGTLPHVIAYLGGAGYAHVSGLVMSIIMITMTGAKISLGALFDRIGPVPASIVTGCSIFFSVAALYLVGLGPFMPFVFALIYGFGSSIMTVPYSYLVSENFGTREFAAIYSFCNMLSGVVTSFGNPLSGALFDRFGNYQVVWRLYMLLALAGTVLLVLSSILSGRGRYKSR
ncbi:MAG: MFS transporter [Clostridiales bacterium]|nr:MFS transporter [Clostridiales bacterium]